MNVMEQRLQNFRKQLGIKGIEAALVSKKENCIYLSGFTGSAGYILISQDNAVLLTDFRYVEQASIQAHLYEVVQYTGSMIKTLDNLLKKYTLKNLGFEESYLTVEKFNEYNSGLEIKELLPLGNIIDDLRMVKSSEEIGYIKRAVEIAEDSFTHILDFIKPGISEREVAAELEYFMKKQGAKGVSFETIIASGKRSAMPHGVASDKILELGDTVTLDFGCIYEDYCSDMTRTVFLGNPPEEMKKIYGIVLEAQLRALEGAHKGLMGKEIDNIARKIITGYGYDKNFGHGLGHGVGLEVHEAPRLSPNGDINMENGMVVTIEPGIYLQGLGGIRIEDMIIIDSDNPKVLNRSKKDIIII